MPQAPHTHTHTHHTHTHTTPTTKNKCEVAGKQPRRGPSCKATGRMAPRAATPAYNNMKQGGHGIL
eukprot:1413593-Prorocentrum_lima.AAC.1